MVAIPEATRPKVWTPGPKSCEIIAFRYSSNEILMNVGHFDNHGSASPHVGLTTVVPSLHAAPNFTSESGLL